MTQIAEICWHGRAGQGAKTAALMLAEAGLKEGKHIQGFPEYGPEREGAPIRAYTRISTQPIRRHCQVTSPEAVVVLDDSLLDVVDVTAGLLDKGFVLVNTTKSSEDIGKKVGWKKSQVYTVDATGISLDILKRNLPNMPMLGALVAATHLIKLDTLMDSIKKKFEKKFGSEIVEGNIKAIKKAYEEVGSQCS